MKKKLVRYIFFILIVIIVAAVIIGYGIWNKPHQNIKDAIAFKTTAVQLYTDLTNDSSQMKAQLINKVVAVSGEVTAISKNQQNQQIILLKTGIPGGSVNCTMEENLTHIHAGDKVLIKGICLGYAGAEMEMNLPGDVFLVRCYPST